MSILRILSSYVSCPCIINHNIGYTPGACLQDEYFVKFTLLVQFQTFLQAKFIQRHFVVWGPAVTWCRGICGCLWSMGVTWSLKICGCVSVLWVSEYLRIDTAAEASSGLPDMGCRPYTAQFLPLKRYHKASPTANSPLLCMFCRSIQTTYLYDQQITTMQEVR